ncbi:hypothetical protein [Streptomyces sp. 6-11-2]|uniref:hypothetical protein n=1 Tax=Streptomyces sp. 6-11-2 TaxID=2585753 RepID=UPI0011441D51|nr:hypothetical protein [Streptomyces sp. 6-11-2]GED90704.1 hypothetical protein TNCT6_77890 [Streptomyces sp. 6-11-2]
MSHWVYAFSGCPDTKDFQQIADDQEPGAVVLRERAGGLGTVDGFVRESVDDLMMVARFRWVASGDPSTVAPAVLQASGLPPLTRRGARSVRAGSEPDASDFA